MSLFFSDDMNFSFKMILFNYFVRRTAVLNLKKKFDVISRESLIIIIALTSKMLKRHALLVFNFVIIRLTADLNQRHSLVSNFLSVLLSTSLVFPLSCFCAPLIIVIENNFFERGPVRWLQDWFAREIEVVSNRIQKIEREQRMIEKEEDIPRKLRNNDPREWKGREKYFVTFLDFTGFLCILRSTSISSILLVHTAIMRF